MSFLNLDKNNMKISKVAAPVKIENNDKGPTENSTQPRISNKILPNKRINTEILGSRKKKMAKPTARTKRNGTSIIFDVSKNKDRRNKRPPAL